MRTVLQRVLNASVQIEDKPIASINEGLLVLIGFHIEDNENDIDYIINKILRLRIFDDSSGTMNVSISDSDYEILVVSQFTLYCNTRKGNRPSYSDAMKSDAAKSFYDDFLNKFKSRYHHVCSGVFGTLMNVTLTNHGPVTIILDSKA